MVGRKTAVTIDTIQFLDPCRAFCACLWYALQLFSLSSRFRPFLLLLCLFHLLYVCMYVGVGISVSVSLFFSMISIFSYRFNLASRFTNSSFCSFYSLSHSLSLAFFWLLSFSLYSYPFLPLSLFILPQHTHHAPSSQNCTLGLNFPTRLCFFFWLFSRFVLPFTSKNTYVLMLFYYAYNYAF